MDLQKRFGNFEKRRQHFLDLAFFLSNIGYSHGSNVNYFRSSKLAKEHFKISLKIWLVSNFR